MPKYETITSSTFHFVNEKYPYNETKSNLFKEKMKGKVKNVQIDWMNFVTSFKNQVVPNDEECTHEKVVTVQKQVRCADEMETCFITCRLCGKTEQK